MCTAMAAWQYCIPIWVPITSVDISCTWSPANADLLTWSFYHNPSPGSGRQLLTLPSWGLHSPARTSPLPGSLCMRMMTAVFGFRRNRSVCGGPLWKLKLLQILRDGHCFPGTRYKEGSCSCCHIFPEKMNWNPSESMNQSSPHVFNNVVQWIKALASKPDDLRSVPRTPASYSLTATSVRLGLLWTNKQLTNR